MKKMLAILLAAMLLLGCTALAEAVPDILGTWYGSMAGVTMELELKDDGTYSMKAFGDETNGTWETEGDKLYMDRGAEGETVMDFTAEALTFAEANIVFTREPIEAFVPPAKAAVDDITAFDGTWEGTLVCVEGITLDIAAAKEVIGEMLDMKNTQLVIDNGNVSVFGADALLFELADGHLVISAGEMKITIDMNEDGSIVLETAGIQFFFEKVDEAADAA